MPARSLAITEITEVAKRTKKAAPVVSLPTPAEEPKPMRKITPRTKATTPKRSSAPKIKIKKVAAPKKAKTAVTPNPPKATKSKIPLPTAIPQLRPGQLVNLKRDPLGHLLVEKLLREAGFRGLVASEKDTLERYSTDESIFSITPQIVLQPKNRRDVEIAATVIAKETKRFTSLSLTPRAAGTGLSGGSLSDSIVVDVCTHLTHIGEVEKKKDIITITCEPGAMWRDVEKRLKRHHAYLPPYTSSKDICSIGGSIGNNAAGPDSLRYGHCADWVESLEVVLADGHTYTVRPMNFREYKLLCKQKHAYAKIATAVFDLIERNEAEILKNKPSTPKNTAGYALWKVFSHGVAAFKKGEGTFDLTRLICGSQGTIGIVTEITMRALPIQEHTTLIAVPIFDLQDAATVVQKALAFNPINIELFDALTFDLALKNPNFFKERLDRMAYYRTMLSMYTTYHVRYGRKTPEFTILITVDKETAQKHSPAELITTVSSGNARARIVQNPVEAEMLWLIRRASYTLSKLQDPSKRPAAFLEDMTVPPESLSKFFLEIKQLFKEFNVTAAVHGHGGNGHFHFYPLLDFTNATTPLLVERMAERFFATALKYKGTICGEHNDGIIRTPHLSKMFSAKMLELFKQMEHIFDPDDIFNPGKKVNPRYDIKTTMRKTN